MKSVSKIPWVNWDDVCKSKSRGGLEVKDLWMINFSLLMKWKCRLLLEDSRLWRDILIARYEGIFTFSYSGCMVRGLHSSLSWWKDISLLRTKEKCSSYWFSKGIARKMGSDIQTFFLEDLWLGNIPLICSPISLARMVNGWNKVCYQCGLALGL